jgi:hypothetical protein
MNTLVLVMLPHIMNLFLPIDVVNNKDKLPSSFDQLNSMVQKVLPNIFKNNILLG